jgi:hypothetical protein
VSPKGLTAWAVTLRGPLSPPGDGMLMQNKWGPKSPRGHDPR